MKLKFETDGYYHFSIHILNEPTKLVYTTLISLKPKDTHDKRLQGYFLLMAGR